jgi:5-methylthioribose kinase
LGRIVKPDDPDEVLAGTHFFFDKRKNVFPMEKICNLRAKIRPLIKRRNLPNYSIEQCHKQNFEVTVFQIGRFSSLFMSKE